MKNTFLSFVLLLALASLARAGTPLICHPYNIGNARSLPGGSAKGTDPSYDRSRLTTDTLALLTPDTPVLVRMETLRRAAIYATGNLRKWQGTSYTTSDKIAAQSLVDALRARTVSVTEANADMALFDLGFFAETLRQTQLDPALDGYPLLVKVGERRPQDADVQFALALASIYPDRKPDHGAHLQLARAGAAPGSLLAANLQSHFNW
jgi:hypothetical protein